MLDIGAKAPDFDLENESGVTMSLSALKGKKVVLYFYPKDNTPGCTVEGKDFSSLTSQFLDHNSLVFGISKDSVQSHEKFSRKYLFTHALLSDPDGEVCEKYGVWVEKKNYGRTYMGISRSTFLIDESGVITQVWRNVRSKGHAQKVLTEVTGAGD